MSKRLALVAFAAAAIGLCAWVLSLDGDEALAAPVARGAAEAPVRPDRRPATMPVPDASRAADPETPRAEPAAERTVPPAPAPARVERTPAGEDEIALRVVAPDGAPVAGAEVLFLRTDDEDTLDLFWTLAAVDELMATEGQARTTDPDGLADVPAPGAAWTLVLARHGALWGSLTVDAELARETPVEMELATDVTLRARVVDRDGAPVAGADVELRARERWGSYSLLDASSGDGGIAVLRHAQDRMADEPDHGWALGLGALLDPAVEAPLDAEELPRDAVTLVLPPAGAVTIDVRTIDGKPFTGSARATLGIVREGEPDRVSPFSDIRRPTVDTEVSGGAARFPHVALGQRLAVSVARQDSRVSTWDFGAGPTAAGEVRSFEVVLGDDHPVARLTALDEADARMAGAELHVTVTTDAGSFTNSDQISVVTDERGAFEVDLDPAWTEGSERELLVSHRPDGGEPASGRVDASRLLQDGVNDLGAVRLAPAPLFVSGQVVSVDGEPRGDAALVLHTRRAGKDRWSRNWRFEQRTDGEGGFEVRGMFSGDEFRIGVADEGWAGPLREFRPGESGVLIEVDAEGAIAGQVLLNESFPSGIARLELTGEVDYLDYSDRRASFEEDGSFRFAGLLRGEYGVRLRVDGHGKKPFELEGLVVAPGLTTRDPRLDPLDLRGTLHAHHVTLEVGEETERLNGKARFGEVGADDLAAHVYFHQADFWIASQYERLDVELDSADHEILKLEDVAGEIRATLTRKAEVHLVLAPGAPLPDPPVYIRAVLAPTDDRNHSIAWDTSAFDDSREITAPSPGEGEMKVVWIVERRSSGSAIASSVTLDPPQLVTVTGEPGQRIEIQLTAEQLAELVGDR